MKSKYFFNIILILTVFLFSCEKEINFNGDEIKTKLVLNGILTLDSVVKINLTESRFFLDDYRSFKEINNATVELWKDDNRIENLLNTGDGYYTGTYIPETGDNIRITASCEGFDQIECSTAIIAPTTILSVDTINYKEERYYYNYKFSEDGISEIDSSSYYTVINFDLFITFKDPQDIPNYYDINLYLKCYFSNGDSLFLPVNYNSDDLVFRTGNEMGFLEDNDYLKSTLFNDELLDGKEYKLKIKTNNWAGISVDENPYNADSEKIKLVGTEIFLELKSLSYSYYMYQKTRDANSNMSGLIEYFSEPVQIFSNVKGGIGILGSYSNSVYILPLK